MVSAVAIVVLVDTITSIGYFVNIAIDLNIHHFSTMPYEGITLRSNTIVFWDIAPRFGIKLYEDTSLHFDTVASVGTFSSCLPALAQRILGSGRTCFGFVASQRTNLLRDIGFHLDIGFVFTIDFHTICSHILAFFDIGSVDFVVPIFGLCFAPVLASSTIGFGWVVHPVGQLCSSSTGHAWTWHLISSTRLLGHLES